MTKLSIGDVAVVTGAARGIGLGLAQAFATRGLRVVIADIDPDALEVARAELAATGAEVLAVPTDVSRADSVFELADATRARFGTFDVICNNAGIGNDFSAVWEKPLEDWERMVSVNLWSVVHGIRAFVPHLVEKNSGHVLNTASMLGLAVMSGEMGDYAMAKFGVVGLTETLSLDLEKYAPGVRATILCPGFIRTPLAEAQIAKAGGATATGTTDESAWGAALEPADAAAVTLHAIEADLLYALPADDAQGLIQPRFDRLQCAIEQQAPLRQSV